MKKVLSFALLSAVLLTGVTLHAQAKKIPVIWKAKTTAPVKYQITAFGFYEDKDEVIFAIQFKDLQEMLTKNPSMAVYFNMDNKIETGRFPKIHGWDLQINSVLNRKASFQTLEWNEKNEAKTLQYMKGEQAFAASKDTVFYVISKNMLGKKTFAPEFRITVSPTVKGVKTRTIGINDNVLVKKADKLGTLDMPEIK